MSIQFSQKTALIKGTNLAYAPSIVGRLVPVSARKLIIITLAAFIASGCHTAQRKYINGVLNIMEKNSVNRDAVNWKELKAKVRKNARGAKTHQDAYHSVYYALDLLGDNHSIFIPPTRMKEFNSAHSTLPEVTHRLVNNDIAYIKIPPFLGNDSLATLLAERIQSIIKDYDKPTILNWMVDLRENRGGNMWPMFLGIGPLLGEGVHGYFVDPDHNYLAWSYACGEVFEGERHMQKIDTAYTLQNTNRKIAVLIDNNTASSGEAIAVCFKGLDNTRFFGEQTYGLTSSNNEFKLPDDAKLYLTVSRFTDRKKKLYPAFIAPDEVFLDPVEAFNAAVRWLKN